MTLTIDYLHERRQMTAHVDRCGDTGVSPDGLSVFKIKRRAA
jgi:hypothetical protein